MLVELQSAMGKETPCWGVLCNDKARHPVTDLADHLQQLAGTFRDGAPIIILVGSKIEAERLHRAYVDGFQTAPDHAAPPGTMPTPGQVSFLSYDALLGHMAKDGPQVLVQRLAEMRTVILVDRGIDLSVDADLVLASLMISMKEERAPLFLLVLSRSQTDIDVFRYHIGEPFFALDISENLPPTNIEKLFNVASADIPALIDQSLRAGQNVLYFGDKPPGAVHSDCIIKISANSSWPANLLQHRDGHVIVVPPSAWSRAFLVPNLGLVVSASPEYRVQSNLGQDVLHIDRMEKLTAVHHDLQLQFAEQAGVFVAPYRSETIATFPHSPLEVLETRDQHPGDIMRLAMGLSWLFPGRETWHIPVAGITNGHTLVLIGYAWIRLDALKLAEFPSGTTPQHIPQLSVNGRRVCKLWVQLGRGGFYAANALCTWISPRRVRDNPAAMMWFVKLGSVIPWLHDLLPSPLPVHVMREAVEYGCAYSPYAHFGSLFVAACIWEAARAELTNAPPQDGERWVVVFGNKVAIEVVERITEGVQGSVPNGDMDPEDPVSAGEENFRLFLVSQPFINRALLVRNTADTSPQAPRARMLQSCVRVDMPYFAPVQDIEDSVLAFMTNGVSIDVTSNGLVRPVIIPDDLTIIPSATLFLKQFMPEMDPNRTTMWLNSLPMPTD